jgi:hypothetical protein
MKKILFVGTLFLAFTLFPSKPNAVLMLDENGKPIDREIKDGEFIIMTSPDDTVSSDETRGNASSDGKSVEPNYDLPRDINTRDVEPSGKEPYEGEVYLTTQNTDEAYRTTGVEEDALTTTSVEEKKDNNFLIGLLSGSAGILLGATGSYLILLKRR